VLSPLLSAAGSQHKPFLGRRGWIHCVVEHLDRVISGLEALCPQAKQVPPLPDHNRRVRVVPKGPSTTLVVAAVVAFRSL